MTVYRAWQYIRRAVCGYVDFATLDRLEIRVTASRSYGGMRVQESQAVLVVVIRQQGSRGLHGGFGCYGCFVDTCSVDGRYLGRYTTRVLKAELPVSTHSQ